MFKLSTSDATRVRIVLNGVDADNLETGPLTNTTASVDDTSKATIAPDPAAPGQWLVNPIKQSAPVAGGLVVNVTVTDVGSGNSDNGEITFTAGTATSVTASATAEPIPAS